jgi:hypothetical protein
MTVFESKSTKFDREVAYFRAKKTKTQVCSTPERIIRLKPKLLPNGVNLTKCQCDEGYR